MAEAPRRIEQSGLPTALMWHPLLGSDFEDRLVMIMFAFEPVPYYEYTSPLPPPPSACLSTMGIAARRLDKHFSNR